MTRRTVCFSHGKESGPWGSKIKALAAVAEASGWQVESLDYRGMDDPLERLEHLRNWVRSAEGEYVLAGSSMGGAIAAAIAPECQPIGVFLMAPAFYVPGYEDYAPRPPTCPVCIVHGWHDEIIPWENSTRFGEQSGARVVLVDADHRLIDALPQVELQFSVFLSDVVSHREEQTDG